MSVEIGTYGVWRRTGDLTPEFARQIEDLGYHTLWVGGSPPAGLADVESFLDATDRIAIATGVVNMWRADAAQVAESYHRIAARHANRFLLGVGIGHPEATRQYAKPFDTMVSYLDELDAAGMPQSSVILAALGPRALQLAAERTAGSHPYLTTPRHTRQAREILGAGPLLAPEHKAVVEGDPEQARRLGREAVSRYLDLVNYRRNLLREGWAEDDLTDGGSNALIDALVLHGTAEDIAAGLRSHLEAGADHVSVHALGADPIATLRAVAGAVGL